MSESLPKQQIVYEGRPEYEACDIEDLLVATEMADELLQSTIQTPGDTFGGDSKLVGSYDGKSTDTLRTFSYLESGTSSGWNWPLTETKLTIRHSAQPSKDRDTYYVEVAHEVHQINIEQPPLVTIYAIEYSGKHRDSVTASVDCLNFELFGPSEDMWEERPLTYYDAELLFTELGNVWNLQQIEEKKQLRLDGLA